MYVINQLVRNILPFDDLPPKNFYLFSPFTELDIFIFL